MVSLTHYLSIFKCSWSSFSSFVDLSIKTQEILIELSQSESVQKPRDLKCQIHHVSDLFRIGPLRRVVHLVEEEISLFAFVDELIQTSVTRSCVVIYKILICHVLQDFLF